MTIRYFICRQSAQNGRKMCDIGRCWTRTMVSACVSLEAFSLSSTGTQSSSSASIGRISDYHYCCCCCFSHFRTDTEELNINISLSRRLWSWMISGWVISDEFKRTTTQIKLSCTLQLYSNLFLFYFSTDQQYRQCPFKFMIRWTLFKINLLVVQRPELNLPISNSAH